MPDLSPLAPFEPAGAWDVSPGIGAGLPALPASIFAEDPDGARGARDHDLELARMLAQGGTEDFAAEPSGVPVVDEVVRRYAAGDAGAEELILTFYHANVSLSRMQRIIASLWKGAVGVQQIARQAHGIEDRLRSWQQRAIVSQPLYVFLDATVVVQRGIQGKKSNTMHTATGVSAAGFREVLAVTLATGPEMDGWSELLRQLAARGVKGAKLFIAENCGALHPTIRAQFPGALIQGSIEQLSRDVLRAAPISLYTQIMARFAALEASTTVATDRTVLLDLSRLLHREGAAAAAAILDSEAPFLSSFRAFPAGHRKVLQHGVQLLRLFKLFREWVRLGGGDCDPSALLAVALAQLKYGTRNWDQRRFFR